MSRTGSEAPAGLPAAATSAALRNRLKFRQLALLAELEVAGSLHKAAERLGMSQPAATRLVQELEELMGASLFERSNRGMSPTDMGRLLMRHASVLLAGIDHVYQEAAALRSGSAGILRIGMNPGAPPAPVAQATLQLKRETPRMEVHIVQGSNETLLEDLREGSLDVVVGRAPAGSGTESFDFELLYAEHFSVVCGPHNPRQGAPCRFEELVDLPWILPSGSTALRKNLELLFLSRCGRMPDDCIEAVASPIVTLLVTQGHRVAAVPGWLAREQVRTGQMQVLIARLPNITGPIGITRRAGEVATTQALRFVEALRLAGEAWAAPLGDTKSGSPLPNT
jgi:molybdate transport repressor ModE-like protein